MGSNRLGWREHWSVRLRSVATASLTGVVIASCAAAGVHPEDSGDACAAQRAELRGAENYYAQSIVQGALIGGVVGGLTGWLVGDSGKSAAIGAAAGAVAGGVGGYYMAKRKVASDAAGVSSAVLKDVVADSQEIDKATLAFAKLRDCRFGAAQQVKADLAAGRISRAQAVSRLDDLQRRFAEDVTIAQQVGAKMADRSKEFQYASDELVKEDPAAVVYLEGEKRATARAPQKSTAARPKPAPTKGPSATESLPPGAPPAVAVAKATETNQLKQKAFSEDVALAKAQAKSAFSLEGEVGLVLPTCVACGTT